MKNYIIIITAIITLVACKKPKEVDGPLVTEFFGPFNVTESFKASADTFNFTSTTLQGFYAQFNRNATWKITIKGLQSGAVKEIIGISKTIDLNNGVWNGSTTFLPAFKSESCEAVLTVENESVLLKDTVFIKNIKALDQGIVVANFETNNPGFFIDYSSDGDTIRIESSPLKAPYGNNYFLMRGYDKSGDTYLGQLGIEAKDINATDTVFRIETKSSSELYFNMMVYGFGVPSLLKIQFGEDENRNRIADNKTEDVFAKSVLVDWVGWKVLSIKYSETTLDNATATGNKKQEPDKIGIISFIHLTTAVKGKAAYAFDYMIFTTGKPFQP